VTFHNGDRFTAADVAYTIGVITDPKAQLSVPSNYSWLAGVEVVDDYTVRLKLKQAFPAALEYVAFVMPIYPKDYRERVGREGYKKEPVGAGPYKITRVDGVSQIDMERYEGYYEGSSKGRPPIRKLVIKQVTDATAELTALLGGQADWIWQFNPDQFDNIAKMPNTTAVFQEAFRLLFVGIDAAGRSGEKNPLTDVRVRRAINYAVDRQTFARQLIRGNARVPNGPCYLTQFGCEQDAMVAYEYNPAKAKALLAEAGYPNGFDTEIVSGNMLTSWSGALQNYLAAVGIRAKVNTLQATAGIARWEKGDVPLYLSSWGSYSVNDVSAIMPYFFSGGAQDYARDKVVIEALRVGGTSIDPAARRAAYRTALHQITDQAYWLPISTYVTTYGLSRQLDFKTWPDEMPRYFQAKWK
jgi:peptide/nickel transport system substrate-binding protein